MNSFVCTLRRVSEERVRTEGMRHAKDEELHKVRALAEEMRRDFMRQLKDKDALLETQRKDMGASFDELVKVLESEGSERETSLRAELKRKEAAEAALKEQLRKSECERGELQRKAESAVAGGKDHDKRRKEVEWELEDLGRKSAARIKELEQEVRAFELAKKASAEEHQERVTGLERDLHSLERAFTEQQERMAEQHRKAMSEAEADNDAKMSGYETKLLVLGGRLAVAEGERERQVEAARLAGRDLADLEALRVKETQAHQSRSVALLPLPCVSACQSQGWRASSS